MELSSLPFEFLKFSRFLTVIRTAPRFVIRLLCFACEFSFADRFPQQTDSGNAGVKNDQSQDYKKPLDLFEISKMEHGSLPRDPALAESGAEIRKTLWLRDPDELILLDEFFPKGGAKRNLFLCLGW
jgi:hypothetical protein